MDECCARAGCRLGGQRGKDRRRGEYQLWAEEEEENGVRPEHCSIAQLTHTYTHWYDKPTHFPMI